MSKKSIKYLGSTIRGHYGDIASVKFDKEPEELLERSDDDIRTRGAFKSFRIAQIDGELYVLVMESKFEFNSDPREIMSSFSEIDGDFDRKIELPNDAFSCYGQRNAVRSVIKINKEGFLEAPSPEILDDLLSRKSYEFSCGGYHEDDWEHNDSFDVYDGYGDLDDEPFVDTLTAEELGIEATNVPNKGMTLIVAGKAIRIRENGTVRDTKGNRYQNGELVIADKEKAPTPLEVAAAENAAADKKYKDVLARAKAKRNEVSGPGDNIGE